MTLEQAIKMTRDHIRIGYGMIEEGYADMGTYQIPQALEMVLNEMESRQKVVRCKDCKYYKPNNEQPCDNPDGLWGIVALPDDYCSHGERK